MWLYHLVKVLPIELAATFRNLTGFLEPRAKPEMVEMTTILLTHNGSSLGIYPISRLRGNNQKDVSLMHTAASDIPIQARKIRTPMSQSSVYISIDSRECAPYYVPAGSAHSCPATGKAKTTSSPSQSPPEAGGSRDRLWKALLTIMVDSQLQRDLLQLFYRTLCSQNEDYIVSEYVNSASRLNLISPHKFKFILAWSLVIC